MRSRSASGCAVGKAPRRAAFLAGLLSLPQFLPAQSAEIRDDLTRFQVETGLATDTLQLRRAERQLNAAGTTQETEAIRRIRRGLVRLRLGELGDGWSFGRAAGDFGHATQLEPQWSYAWFARGLAQRAEGDWQAADRRNLGKRVGFGSIEDGVESFAKAIATDPTNGAAALALFESALTLRDTTRFTAVVLPSLRQAAATGLRDTAFLLALGRIERLVGDPHAATAAFARYMELGGERGLSLRELAWSGFLAGDTTADTAYYAAAREDDSVTVSTLRDDLALIADDGELTAFDRAAGIGRETFLRRFWTDHGHQALRDPGERLREHYRRISYAERHFGLEVNRRFYSMEGTDMYRSGSMRFDDRGIVYVRYGEPDVRVATLTWGIQPNESWRYYRADGDLLLHFAANEGGDIRDYRLVPSVTAIGGVDQSNGGRPATYFAFADRCSLYSPFCKYTAWGPNGQARALSEERRLVRASVEWAVSTEGYELHFSRGLTATATAFAVGRQGDQQLVHVVYQVALEARDSLARPDGYRVPLRVRVNLFDSAGRSTGWLDTTTTLLFPGGGLENGTADAVGRVVLSAPSGRWHYRISLMQGDSLGRVLPTDSIEVGEFSGSALAVSDLVLSKDGVGARWVPAPGDTAFFNPRRTWARSDILALYHEIYGLTAGAPYTATLVVLRGKREALRLAWEGLATGSVTRLTRTLSLNELKRGDYVLELKVRDQNGRESSSRRQLRVE